MAGLLSTLNRLRHARRHVTDLLGKQAEEWGSAPDAATSRLRQTTDFGSNPGNLQMLSYVPVGLAAGAPLVVVLHGCTQSAAGYDAATGWSDLADRIGFALLYPQQTRENNPNLCFNWFQPGDIGRDQGEALSIKQMVDTMATEHGLDRRRITITGLSAGGAMACVMLATYPEMFAAGTIIAGLPFGCATNLQQALDCMMQGRARSADVLTAMVRNASSHDGPWPRISIWHGDADKTVVPANAEALVKQWTGLHDLSPHPTIDGTRDGVPYRAWQDASGKILVESITVTGMGHGAPIATGRDPSIGHAAAFVLDVGISSTLCSARFWGLTEAMVAEDAPHRPATVPTLFVPGPHREPTSRAPESRAETAKEGAASAQRGRAFDPGAFIQQALRAAGLMN